jgi:hypothetical protein
MVKAKWVDNRLIVEPVTPDEQARLDPYVQDTLSLDLVAVFDGVAYANNEQQAREHLE